MSPEYIALEQRLRSPWRMTWRRFWRRLAFFTFTRKPMTLVEHKRQAWR
jgi:hypothetical protein